MNSFSSRLRLLWAAVRNGGSFSSAYVNRLYSIYLNHHKVIHFRDGYPVYSLSTPALFSEPAANFFARSLFRTIQNKNLPNLMSFAVNDACNVGCEHCSFFEGVHDSSRSTLSLEESVGLIRDAQDLGVSIINFVGGEPLLRNDLAEIIRSVDRSRSTTVLFTNGWLLKQQARALRTAGLDSVYISIDSADPAEHDRFRKRKGLFDRAIEGIVEARSCGMSTGISATLTPESFAAGELDRIVELAKQVGVHEVLVFDALPTGRYQHRTDLVDANEWVEDMIRSGEKYATDMSYPGVVFFAYMTSYRSVGCSCGTSYFYISPYGDLMSCDFNHAIYGNILTTPLWKLWDQMTTRAEYCHAKWGGCKIKSAECREAGIVTAGTVGKRCCS